MKKFALLIFGLLAIQIAANSQSPCLPEGIVFNSQEQIDNFQTNYPGCTEIEGDVTIWGDDITNLYGLYVVTLIGDTLNIIYNDSLTSLVGLESLTSIGGSLIIGVGISGGNPALIDLTGLNNLLSISENLSISSNQSLESLNGMQNLISVGGYLDILGNNTLPSLTGLENLIDIGGHFRVLHNYSMTSLSGSDNINAGSISNLMIGANYLLSTCDVQSVCEYLANPNGTVLIFDNAPGCNSLEEVVAACEAVTVESIDAEENYFLSPNPANQSVTISFKSETLIEEVTIFNQTGQKVYSGLPENNSLDISNLQPGMYIIELKTKQGVAREKLVVK